MDKINTENGTPLNENQSKPVSIDSKEYTIETIEGNEKVEIYDHEGNKLTKIYIFTGV